MKFGKLPNVDEVDFQIPPLHIIEPKKTGKLNIFLGTTGWSNKDWNGSYYPKGTRSAIYLNEYAKLFNTIELNTTHYHIPSAERVSTWASKVESGFLFCPKVPQSISHRSNLASETSQSHSFYNAIKNFKDHLGPCFMQLSEYFSPQNAEQLVHFLNRKPRDIRFALELRHPDWFKNGNQELLKLALLLNSLNTSLVITDVAGRRDVCHNVLLSSTLILRLVGNNLHSSDFTRMDTWVNTIYENQNDLKEVYIFFHQPKMTEIPEMVNYFIEKLLKIGLESPITSLKPKYQANIQLRLF